VRKALRWIASAAHIELEVSGITEIPMARVEWAGFGGLVVEIGDVDAVKRPADVAVRLTAMRASGFSSRSGSSDFRASVADREDAGCP